LKKKTQSNSLPFTLHFPKIGKEPLNDEKKRRRKNPFLISSQILTMQTPNMTLWKTFGMIPQCLPEK